LEEIPHVIASIITFLKDQLMAIGEIGLMATSLFIIQIQSL